MLQESSVPSTTARRSVTRNFHTPLGSSPKCLADPKRNVPYNGIKMVEESSSAKVSNGEASFEILPDGDSNWISRSRKDRCWRETVTSTNSVNPMPVSSVSVSVTVVGLPANGASGNVNI